LSAVKALFLDRDGVINVDHGYVSRQEDFQFVAGIFDLARAASAAGYLLFVITNQAGIGRGYYTEDDFHRLTEWMCRRFAEEGAPIRKVYFCPTHPTAGIGAYRCESPDRKPNPGMIMRAAREFDIDLSSSVLIGDKHGDIDAGRAAGIGLNVLFEAASGTDASHCDGYRVVRSLRQARDLLPG
jgi:D-glycero-D-manno-heptose 1,7-bisphosphate phosphatase